MNNKFLFLQNSLYYSIIPTLYTYIIALSVGGSNVLSWEASHGE